MEMFLLGGLSPNMQLVDFMEGFVMNTIPLRAALGGLLVATAGAALAGATVTFTAPDKFSDVPFSSVERERVLEDLSGFIVKLATKLPAGQELKVEVLDVDLAGEVKPTSRGRDDLRILRGGADWPQIHLRYSLEQNGAVIKSGDERLADMNYLDRGGYTGRESSLRYEKQMLETWFRTKVLSTPTGASVGAP